MHHDASGIEPGAALVCGAADTAMKLAYLSETKIPSRSASAVHVLKMCEAFSELGHDVTLFYVRTDAVDLQRILDAHGIRQRFDCVGIPVAARRSFLYEYGLRAGRRVRALRCDLAICRTVPGALACAVLGVAVVYEAHMPTRDRSRATDRLFRLLLRRRALRGVVVISESLKQHFECHYALNGRQVLVLPDAA